MSTCTDDWQTGHQGRKRCLLAFQEGPSHYHWRLDAGEKPRINVRLLQEHCRRSRLPIETRYTRRMDILKSLQQRTRTAIVSAPILLGELHNTVSRCQVHAIPNLERFDEWTVRQRCHSDGFWEGNMDQVASRAKLFVSHHTCGILSASCNKTRGRVSNWQACCRKIKPYFDAVLPETVYDRRKKLWHLPPINRTKAGPSSVAKRQRRKWSFSSQAFLFLLSSFQFSLLQNIFNNFPLCSQYKSKLHIDILGKISKCTHLCADILSSRAFYLDYLNDRSDIERSSWNICIDNLINSKLYSFYLCTSFFCMYLQIFYHY